jgi:hypothetical protein
MRFGQNEVIIEPRDFDSILLKIGLTAPALLIGAGLIKIFKAVFYIQTTTTLDKINAFIIAFIIACLVWGLMLEIIQWKTK